MSSGKFCHAARRGRPTKSAPIRVLRVFETRYEKRSPMRVGAQGLPSESNFAAIVAGVSGYEGRVYGAPPEMPTRHFTLMHDAPVAHAGALAGMPGVVVIAGTGSVVYARDENGRSQTLGGWGFLFGDEGSAFSHCPRCARARDGRRGRRRSLAPRRSARGLRFLCNGLTSSPCTRILRRRTHPRAARRLYAGRNSIRRASAGLRRKRPTGLRRSRIVCWLQRKSLERH